MRCLSLSEGDGVSYIPRAASRHAGLGIEAKDTAVDEYASSAHLPLDMQIWPFRKDAKAKGGSGCSVDRFVSG